MACFLLVHFLKRTYQITRDNVTEQQKNVRAKNVATVPAVVLSLHEIEFDAALVASDAMSRAFANEKKGRIGGHRTQTPQNHASNASSGRFQPVPTAQKLSCQRLTEQARMQTRLKNHSINAAGDNSNVAEKLDVRHGGIMYFSSKIRGVPVVKGNQVRSVPAVQY